MARSTSSSRFRTASVSLLAAVAAVGLIGCSSDDSGSSTTTTAEESTTSTTSAAESAATVRFDKQIQQELADVGCYTGSVDGIMGPETDAAIVEFQKAAGLSADGELGPETEAALKSAVSKGEMTCKASTSTTTTAPATTTTAASSGGSPCTATALLEGIGGDPSTRITSYVCADGYAAGTLGDGSTRFILVATDGSWERPSQDPCGSASAGLPPVILQDGCPD